MSAVSSSTLERPVPRILKLLASYDKETFQAQSANETIILTIEETTQQLKEYGASHWLLLRPLARCAGNILSTTQDELSVQSFCDDLYHSLALLLERADAIVRDHLPQGDKEKVIIDLTEEIQLMVQSKSKIKHDLLKWLLEPLLTMITNCEERTIKELVELVSTVNLLLRGASRVIRSQLREKLFSPTVLQLSSLLPKLGDYDIQQSVVETLVRLTPTEERWSVGINLFDNDDIISLFCDLGRMDFENECRNFLGVINKNAAETATVLTLPCETIMLENEKLHKPKFDDFKRLHVNFNLHSQSVSFWCELFEDGSGEQMLLKVSQEDVEDSYLLELDDRLLQLTLCLHKPLELLKDTPFGESVLMRIVFRSKYVIGLVPSINIIFANTIQISETVKSLAESLSFQENQVKASQGVKFAFPESSQEDEGLPNKTCYDRADDLAMISGHQSDDCDVLVSDEKLKAPWTPRIHLTPTRPRVINNNLTKCSESLPFFTYFQDRVDPVKCSESINFDKKSSKSTRKCSIGVNLTLEKVGDDVSDKCLEGLNELDDSTSVGMQEECTQAVNNDAIESSQMVGKSVTINVQDQLFETPKIQKQKIRPDTPGVSLIKAKENKTRSKKMEAKKNSTQQSKNSQLACAPKGEMSTQTQEAHQKDNLQSQDVSSTKPVAEEVDVTSCAVDICKFYSQNSSPLKATESATKTSISASKCTKQVQRKPRVKKQTNIKDAAPKMQLRSKNKLSLSEIQQEIEIGIQEENVTNVRTTEDEETQKDEQLVIKASGQELNDDVEEKTKKGGKEKAIDNLEENMVSTEISLNRNNDTPIDNLIVSNEPERITTNNESSEILDETAKVNQEITKSICMSDQNSGDEMLKTTVCEKEIVQTSDTYEETGSNTVWENFINKVDIRKFSPHPNRKLSKEQVLENIFDDNEDSQSGLFEELKTPKVRLSRVRNNKKTGETFSETLPHMSVDNSCKTPSLTPGKRRLFNPNTPNVKPQQENVCTMQFNQAFQLQNSLHIQINLPSNMNFNSNNAQSEDAVAEWKNKQCVPGKIYHNKKKQIQLTHQDSMLENEDGEEVTKLQDTAVTQQNYDKTTQETNKDDTSETCNMHPLEETAESPNPNTIEVVTSTKKANKKTKQSKQPKKSKTGDTNKVSNEKGLCYNKNLPKTPEASCGVYDFPANFEENSKLEETNNGNSELNEENGWLLFSEPAKPENKKQRKVIKGKTKKAPKKSGFIDRIERLNEKPDTLRMDKKINDSVQKTLDRVWSDEYFNGLPELIIEKNKKVDAPSKITTPPFLTENPQKSNKMRQAMEEPAVDFQLFQENDLSTVAEPKDNNVKTYTNKKKLGEQVPKPNNATSKQRKRSKRVPIMKTTPKKKQKPNTEEKDSNKIISNNKPKKFLHSEKNVEESPESMSAFKVKKTINKKKQIAEKAIAETVTSQETLWEKPAIINQRKSKVCDFIECTENNEDVLEIEIEVVPECKDKGSNKDPEIISTKTNKKLEDVEEAPQLQPSVEQPPADTGNLPEVIPESSSISSSPTLVEGTQQENAKFSIIKLLAETKMKKTLPIRAASMRYKKYGNDWNTPSAVSRDENKEPGGKQEDKMTSEMSSPMSSVAPETPCKPVKPVKVIHHKRQESSSDEEEKEREEKDAGRKRKRRRALLPSLPVVSKSTGRMQGKPRLSSTIIADSENENEMQPPRKKAQLDISLSPILEDSNSGTDHELETEFSEEEALLDVSKLSKVGQDNSYLQQLTSLAEEWTKTTSKEVAAKRSELICRFMGVLELETEQAEQRLEKLQTLLQRQEKAKRHINNSFVMLDEVMEEQQASCVVLEKQSVRAQRKLEVIVTNMSSQAEQLKSQVAELQEQHRHSDANKLLANLRAKLSLVL